MGPFSPNLSILAYHRVLPEPDPLLPSEVCAEEFEHQLRVVARWFSVLPLSNAVALLRAGALPPRAACITFDDGYADNATVALPLLRKYGLSATFFISTGFIDGGRMWNDTIIDAMRRTPLASLDLRDLELGVLDVSSFKQRREAIDRLLAALKYRALLDREQTAEQVASRAQTCTDYRPMMRSVHIKLLRDAGMEIGAHTVRHPILANLDQHAAYDEIRNGKAQLEKIVDGPVKSFAYPNGKPGVDYLQAHVRMVQQAGFEAAVTTAWGVANARTDVYQLPRFTPWDKTPGKFLLRMLHNTLRTAPTLASN